MNPIVLSKNSNSRLRIVQNVGAGQHWTRLFLGAALISIIGGCWQPAKIFDETASSFGLRREVVAGSELFHVLYWRDGGPNKSLAVYFGGDGSPENSRDPTPRNPLTLRLIAVDPGPAVYIGRPCYHGLAESVGCSGELWTTGRYSDRIVSSLSGVIRGILIAREETELTLYGYSGGGTLAMLVAARIPEVRRVVTVAANLDTEAWTKYHGHERLLTSLNPVTRIPLPVGVEQRHYVGGRDRIVPAVLLRDIENELGGKVIILDDFDHLCCWEDRWSEILRATIE